MTWGMLVLVVGIARGAAPEAEAVLRGAGCLACHSTDGSAGVGPTLAGLSGAARPVARGGVEAVAVGDADYLRRAITAPDAEVVVGFAPGLMPALPPDDPAVDGLVAAIEALQGGGGAPGDAAGRLGLLAAFALLFTGGHLALSAGPVRRRVVAATSESAFMGLYSLVALAGLCGMAWAFSDAPYVPVWAPAPWTRLVPLICVPVAMVLLVASLTTRSPTAVGQQSAAAAGPQGVTTITRHPMLAGVALWAAAHLLPNGDLAGILLFGSLLVLCLVGMWHIDRRRAAAMGPAWDAFAAQTSRVPFAAALAGRAAVDWAGLGALRVLGGLAGAGLWLGIHQWVFGASPWPL